MPNPDDPTQSTGDVDDPILACQCYDVELVSDLEEPNSVEFEAAVEEDEPVAIVFSATVKDSSGKCTPLHQDGKDGSEELELASGNLEDADSAETKEDKADKLDTGDSARDA